MKILKIIIAIIIPAVAFVASGWAVYRYYSEQGPLVSVRFTSAEGVEKGRTLVKYHGVPIGKVVDLEIDDDARNVRLTLQMKKTAAKLLHTGAEFTIIRPRADSSGLKNLDVLVSGDYIALEIPNNLMKKFDLPHEHCFIGKETIKYKQTSDYHDDLIVKVHAPHIFSSLKIGSSVLYKGYAVGVIDDIDLPYNGKSVILSCRIKSEYAHLVRRNSIFWDLKPIEINWKVFDGFMLNARSDLIQTLLDGGVAFSTPNIPGRRVEENHKFTLSRSVNKEWLYWEPSF